MSDVFDLGLDPASAAAQHRRHLRREIVSRLEASPSIRSQAGRQLFLQELDTALGSPSRRREHDVLRLQLVELVHACAQRPGALRSLAECLEVLEPGTEQITDLYRLVDEWQVIDLFPDCDIYWLRAPLLRLRAQETQRHAIVTALRLHPPAHCATAWHVFAHLAGLNAVGEVPPWLQFLDAVAASGLLPPELTGRLSRLTRSLAGQWGLTLRTEPVESAPGPGMAYLVIQLEKYGGDDTSYLVSYWHQWISPTWQPVRGEDQRVDRAELEATVDRIVFETERRWADKDGPVTIEFVLPWELLNAPVDAWRKELTSLSPTPLAMDYPVVVRSLERLQARHWHRLWRSRWRLLTTRSQAEDAVYFADGDQTDIRLEAILKSDMSLIAMVLNQPPAPRSAGEKQALAGLRAGLPILIWHREQPAESSIRPVLRSLMNSNSPADSGLARLPAYIAQLRQLAWEQDPDQRAEHVGYGFAILWDDPDRQPGDVWPPSIAPDEALHG